MGSSANFLWLPRTPSSAAGSTLDVLPTSATQGLCVDSRTIDIHCAVRCDQNTMLAYLILSWHLSVVVLWLSLIYHVPRPQNLAYRELRVIISMGSAKNLVTTTYTIIGGGLDTRSVTYRGTARARLRCETY